MAHNLNNIKPAAQHVLVFGPPKSGKTQILANLAEQGFKLIWFDLENGSSTLLKLSEEAKNNITLIKIMDTIEAPRAHGTIDKILKGGVFKICDAHGTVDCAICKRNNIFDDNHTELNIPTNHIEADSNTVYILDSASQLTTSINATVTINKDETYKEQFDDWAAQGKYLNRIFNRLQTSPNHWAVTAHEILAEREDGGKRLVPSIGTTNYAVNSAKFFDHVIYMDKVNLKHRAWSSTSYSNNVITGSRLDIEIERMEAPGLGDIFKGIPGIPSNSNSNKQQANNMLNNISNNSSGNKLSAILGAKKHDLK